MTPKRQPVPPLKWSTETARFGQRLTAFIEDVAVELHPGDTWAKWTVKQYHGDRIRQYEQELTATLGPSTRQH